MVHQPPYPPPPPTRAEKQRKTLTIIGIAVAAVLILCIGGVIASQAGKKDDGGATPAAASPSATATKSEPGKPADEETTEEPKPEKIKMPDVVDKNAAVAKDELERLGFTNIELGSADPNDTLVIIAANWTVVEQSHEPGEKVPTDALIVLTCSKKK